MIDQETKFVVDKKIVYDVRLSNRIRYIFSEALAILREREKNTHRPVEWHKMDWRIAEMAPMADIALSDAGRQISVPSDLHGVFQVQLSEAFKLVRDRIKNQNVYYTETEELIRRMNGERLSFRKLAPNYIPT